LLWIITYLFDIQLLNIVIFTVHLSDPAEMLKCDRACQNLKTRRIYESNKLGKWPKASTFRLV